MIIILIWIDVKVNEYQYFIDQHLEWHATETKHNDITT
jgi:hypothetical protein